MWKTELSQSIQSVDMIPGLSRRSNEYLKSVTEAAGRFPVKITRHFMGLMDTGNLRDPLCRQVIPSPAEMWITPEESSDPLNERKYKPLTGLIHKYKNRVLVLLSTQCAMHCRFCFRKETHLGHVPDSLNPDQISEVITYIRHHKTIDEVILSGGDPLMMDDNMLCDVTRNLSSIPHIETLRIHTRMPCALPSRITDDLIHALSCRLTVWFVTHFNHPRELPDETIAACDKIRHHGYPVLNQSVLLKGINDNVVTLSDLSRVLARAGIVPYYLHLLDPCRGTSHFRVDPHLAMQIISDLGSRRSGYQVPILVQDIPGKPAKLRLG